MKHINAFSGIYTVKRRRRLSSIAFFSRAWPEAPQNFPFLSLITGLAAGKTEDLRKSRLTTVCTVGHHQPLNCLIVSSPKSPKKILMIFFPKKKQLLNFSLCFASALKILLNPGKENCLFFIQRSGSKMVCESCCLVFRASSVRRNYSSQATFQCQLTALPSST